MDWIERYNEIDSRVKAWAEEEKVRLIKEVRASGLSQTEIARRLGTNRKFIYRLLKKHKAELGGTTFEF